MTNVQERLAAHYARACEHYSVDSILGIFLVGSQNYGTDIKDSDVDTKCILLPDLYGLTIRPHQIKHLDVDGEICECLTIMQLVANWKKQNMNFLEAMFTKHCVTNPDYADLWEDWVAAMSENMAHYDVRRAVLSMGHQAIHTLAQNPLDYKKQMNFFRLFYAIERLVNGSPYSECVMLPDGYRKFLHIIREEGINQAHIDKTKKSLLEMMDNVDVLVRNMSYPFMPQTVIDTSCEYLIVDLMRRRLVDKDGLYYW